MIEIYYFDKTVKKGNLKDLDKLKNKKIWVDVSNISKEEAEILKDKFNLHHLTAEDLVNQRTRIKVEEFTDYLFCVFYGIKKEKAIELQEMDFIVGKNFIISNHKKEIVTFNELKNDLEKLRGLFEKGVEFIFHRLLDLEIDNFFPVLEEIDDQIETIEEDVAKRPKQELLQKVLKMKRKIVLIKKSALPQREKIGFLAKNDYKFISKEAIPYFRDIYDHAIRVSDSIDNYREAIGGTFDAYMSAVSNSMNEVMKTLSIIATIALPLGVISGIYGTNFAILPGQNFAYGFWMMLLGMFSVIGAMLIFFKKRGWF
ncbi:MAG: magnesium/cobalt transporter CorA [Nanoarchaeota archaeon]|nr:magnesium/cobalt transporter CorA [Nanoarchaeota archaeon]MBU1622758.1 magnesium/cobalt transporter CorA [Nanoarchaeota archaeon]MBU1973774.1 magnesium/cobalt transporter CorA [Nanoarchaeota archaeon]